MSEASIEADFEKQSTATVSRTRYLRIFLFGLLLPLSFAPFHLPGLAVICLAFLYSQLEARILSPLTIGLYFGLGFFGLGISWLYVSINQYGHLNPVLSGFITFTLILYQSFFIIVACFIYRYLSSKRAKWQKNFLFAAVWVLIEYCRANFLGGFPWLLIGTGQFDAPAKALLPIIGIYGLSFLTCLAATLLANYWQIKQKFLQPKTVLPLFLFLLLLLFPMVFKNWEWVSTEKPLSVAVLQENLSMRDKWDVQLFWQLIDKYKTDTEALLGLPLIVMPESAIPIPISYIKEILLDLDDKAKEKNSAILLGIPQTTPRDDNAYYNSLLGLGVANGSYFKQKLVPFGEYFPEIFIPILNYLGIENANIKAGSANQRLVNIHDIPIATLICYELAYPALLRQQLPTAKLLVSISDDGWFGHSLAMYQQLQIAQVISALTGRYQIMANNDGLSSIIDTKGNIVASLPAFKEGILKSTVYFASGSTPWLRFGDLPILIISCIIALICLILRNLSRLPLVSRLKRRYPYQPE